MFEARSPFNKLNSFDNKSQGFARDEIEVMAERDGTQCGICNQIFVNEEEMTALCLCGHLFCKSCLKYYVTHKLKTEFSDVDCPREGCQHFINKQGQVFQSLPKDLQGRYYKIVENLNAIKFRSQKLCPDCGEQMSMLKTESCLFCEKCLKKYCPSCMTKAHPKFARCQNEMIKLLRRQYKFKQCKKCFYVVERIEGCNHMTCTCGYEFCYNCGGYWDNGYHECPPIPVYRRPVSYKVVKRQIPERKALNLAAINILFNTSDLQPKGRKEPIKLLYSKISQAKSSRTRENTINYNNSLVINNKSILQ